jgi:hypothetical protein
MKKHEVFAQCTRRLVSCVTLAVERNSACLAMCPFRFSSVCKAFLTSVNAWIMVLHVGIIIALSAGVPLAGVREMCPVQEWLGAARDRGTCEQYKSGWAMLGSDWELLGNVGHVNTTRVAGSYYGV